MIYQKGHIDEVFVLEAHPKDPRLFLSSGHDGNVIIWNLLTGKLIKKFYNRVSSKEKKIKPMIEIKIKFD